MATYYDLIIRCPACLADNKEPGPASQWYHGKPGCNGKIQIGDDAQMKCASCGEAFHLKVARYAHEGYHSDYRATTPAHFASAISTAGQVTSIAGRQWLIKLLENMGEDW
ncbi:hypothetical protein PMG71_11590 [Roseofilum sp. BLCC_M154]|uniref:C2H2-type domain-containing protein n=1 Tax=Roseofilum acuticapitatum BLCC-M154 TaxID=3022444 RepID=A0ABT7AT39_9CYAN|nr:hypothetical protein [Roseofilum acuticapitatum]MDJ1170071.1 hypothetical protein [Roseofilum acuticapitatum BLCC-M154]